MLPGQQLDARRDSTDYITQTLPSHFWGHELYKGVDILDDHLYVAYSAGLQVWDIGGANAERPDFLDYVDGWEGHFLSWHDNPEFDSFNEDVAVARYSPNQVVIALSGRLPSVGFSIWLYNESTESLTRVYQNNLLNSTEVAMLKHTNGKYYALAAHFDGVQVIDVDKAIERAPCLDNSTTPQVDCVGVDLGKIGTMTRGKHLDVMQTASGKIFVSASDASNSGAVKVDLYELTNPSSPSTAVLKISGLSSYSFGTAMFEQAGHYYMAAIERVSSTNNAQVLQHRRLHHHRRLLHVQQPAGADPAPRVHLGAVPVFLAQQRHALPLLRRRVQQSRRRPGGNAARPVDHSPDQYEPELPES
ncbi:MAG: hypothetical protein HC834_04125 [Rhodospirillales bacterium]|nr:hypothetical protein [Rhodospirillales bacterium]